MNETWKMAIQATLHCLTGCAIGEVLGMVIGTSIGLHNVATIMLSVVLAFIFGYSLAMLPLLRGGFKLGVALKLALAADTISIASMELIDNVIMYLVPGAMDAGITSPLFWASLSVALGVAFIITVPINKWLISRGKGHAVMHEHHGHHSH